MAQKVRLENCGEERFNQDMLQSDHPYAIHFFLWAVSFCGLLSVNIEFGHASQETLLICLGREEEAYHRAKNTGAAYQVNQKLIAKLTTSGSVRPKPRYLRKICHSKDFGPSVEFLRVVLLEGSKVFASPRSGSVHLDAQNKSNIQTLYAETPHLFFSYLSSLQSLAPHAQCLARAIPEINYFIERYKYLETDYSTGQLVDDRAKITRIFEKLKGLDGIIDGCQKELQNRGGSGAKG